MGQPLALTLVAEDRDATVDVVGVREPGAAHTAGLSFATVDQELELEVSRFSRACTIVAEGGPLGGDGGFQDPLDVLEEQSRV